MTADSLADFAAGGSVVDVAGDCTVAGNGLVRLRAIHLRVRHGAAGFRIGLDLRHLLAG